jgi:hypothetical protein
MSILIINKNYCFSYSYRTFISFDTILFNKTQISEFIYKLEYCVYIILRSEIISLFYF